MLVEMSNDINGIMLFILKKDFAEEILVRMLGNGEAMLGGDFGNGLFCTGGNRKYYGILLC